MRDVCFGLPLNYDSGKNSSVALNSKGVTIEVHETQSKLSLGMWYHVGQADGMDVKWGPSREYDTGVRPAVAINDHGTVVEVHRWGPGNEKLVCFVGTVEGDAISFGSPDVYDTGDTPSVALNNDGIVVEVHQSALNDRDLFYRTGRVSGKSVNWNESILLASGNTPRVAINNSGDVVVVFRACNSKEIHYATGKLDGSGRVLSWNTPRRYDWGFFPGVAIADDGFVTMVHEHGDDRDKLNRRVGTLRRDTGEIAFASSAQFPESMSYSPGRQPALACSLDGRMAIQTNVGSGSDLMFSTSLIIDRKEWMSAIFNSIRDKGLWQIAMPASHDAGAYNMSTDRVPEQYRDVKFDALPIGIITRQLAETHIHNIAGQLEMGSRMFDLRPIYRDGRFYAYHDVYGADFEAMLDQFAAFLAETRRELIFLNIFKFAEFDNDRHRTLIDLINAKIGAYIIHPESDKPLTIPFGTLVADGSRAIVTYGDTYIDTYNRQIAPTNIRQGFGNTVGGWEESFYDYGGLANFCRTSLGKYKASETANYAFPWQIAMTGDLGAIGDALKYGSLRGMTAEASAKLARFLAQEAKGHQINVTWADFFEDNRVTDCMIVRNL